MRDDQILHEQSNKKGNDQELRQSSDTFRKPTARENGRRPNFRKAG